MNKFEFGKMLVNKMQAMFFAIQVMIAQKFPKLASWLGISDGIDVKKYEGKGIGEIMSMREAEIQKNDLANQKPSEKIESAKAQKQQEDTAKAVKKTAEASKTTAPEQVTGVPAMMTNGKQSVEVTVKFDGPAFLKWLDGATKEKTRRAGVPA